MLPAVWRGPWEAVDSPSLSALASLGGGSGSYGNLTLSFRPPGWGLVAAGGTHLCGMFCRPSPGAKMPETDE